MRENLENKGKNVLLSSLILSSQLAHHKGIIIVFNLKFVFFEKATKFDEISILLLTNKFVLYVSWYNFEYQSGSQSWNFIHRDQQNPNKVYLFFFDADKFVLSFLLISNKTNFAGLESLSSSAKWLRDGHSNWMSNLLKISKLGGKHR